MKRTWLKRSNPERRARQHARNFGERVDAIHRMPCLVWQQRIGHLGLLGTTTCRGDTVAAHVIPRGMGGARGDLRNLINLCARHHDEAGEHRTSKRRAFEDLYGVNLMVEADRLARMLDDPGFEYGPT